LITAEGRLGGGGDEGGEAGGFWPTSNATRARQAVGKEVIYFFLDPSETFETLVKR
jgi:hypothetical protein